MDYQLDKILKSIQDIETAFFALLDTVQDEKALEQARVQFLGRKGQLQDAFRYLGQVEQKDRPVIGEQLNRLKEVLTQALEAKKKGLTLAPVVSKKFDISMPGMPIAAGGFHPLLQVMDEIKDIFVGMGFSVETGPDIETEYYNFEALNIPEYHPTRDLQDTFFLQNRWVLRTHTSPVQIRTMEKTQPPVRMIAPGRCFRKDTPDASHSPTFHQVEGLCVDQGVTFADLKGVILAFAQKLFGKNVKIRFRPSFFPFTEPSAEYDFSCIICSGKGCRLCKGTGWLEISGAGMVDPAVFGFVSYDSEKYTGYAFGMGVERIALLKYQIDDIRIFYENDLRFLQQLN